MKINGLFELRAEADVEQINFNLFQSTIIKTVLYSEIFNWAHSKDTLLKLAPTLSNFESLEDANAVHGTLCETSEIFNNISLSPFLRSVPNQSSLEKEFS